MSENQASNLLNTKQEKNKILDLSLVWNKIKSFGDEKSEWS